MTSDLRISDLGRIAFGDGDVLIVQVDGAVRPEVRDFILKQLPQLAGRLLMIEPTFKLAVLGRSDAALVEAYFQDRK